MSREEDLGTYQMLWDCERCDTAGLLGLDHRHCPGCGAPQDPERRYYPTDEQKVLVQDHRFHGADKVCEGCDTANAAQADFCVNCGAPMNEAAAARKRDAQTRDEGADFEADDPAARRKREREAQRAGEEPKSGGGGAAGAALGLVGLLFVGGIGLFFLALVAVCLLNVFVRSEVALEVTQHEWVRTVEVEKFKAVDTSKWKDELPVGIVDARCQEKQRSTKQVPDGEECEVKRQDNGDGTFKEIKACTPKMRDEPVMGQWCTYKVNKWVAERTARASGTSLTPAPSWPDPKLAGTKPGTECVGCEREGKRGETYTVRFEADGSDYQCETDEKRWSSLKVGTRWKGSAGLMSSSIDCSDLASED